MKIVLGTEKNAEGISEVFNTVTFPEDVAPASLIARWKNLATKSPIQAIPVTGKENVAIGSVRDEATDTYTMAAGTSPEHAKNLEDSFYVFLVDNVVNGIYQSSIYGHTPGKIKAAFSAPIYIIEVEDDNPVDLGYTWDGTNFYPPAIV